MGRPRLHPRPVVGQRYGETNLFIEAEAEPYVLAAGTRDAKRFPQWVCRCLCPEGKVWTVIEGNITQGKVISCGCLGKKHRTEAVTTHGMADTSEYRSWQDMRNRCNDPKNKKYKDYGARGIKVCEEWNQSFEAFFRDMGLKPSPEHTLERADNDGNYLKPNCFWATRQVQANNRRSNRWITYKGERVTLAEAIRRSGLPVSTVDRRIRRGLPEDRWFEPICEARKKKA